MHAANHIDLGDIYNYVNITSLLPVDQVLLKLKSKMSQQHKYSINAWSVQW